MLIPLTLPWHESNGAVAEDGALVQVKSCGTLVIFITSSGEIFLLIIHCQFCFFCTFQYIKKKKKNSVAGLFSCAISLLQESISSGFENFKASSLGSVGKLTERKWNTHMESNTVRRVTLELT